MRPANGWYLIHPSDDWSYFFFHSFRFLLSIFGGDAMRITARRTVALIESINILQYVHSFAVVLLTTGTASYLIIFYWAAIFGNRMKYISILMNFLHVTAYYTSMPSTCPHFSGQLWPIDFRRTKESIALRCGFIFCVCAVSVLHLLRAMLLFFCSEIIIILINRFLSLFEFSKHKRHRNCSRRGCQTELVHSIFKSIFLFVHKLKMRRGTHCTWTRWPTIDQARTISCIHASQ